MTIKDVRRIMGKKVEHLTDDELLKKMIETDKELEEFFQKTIKKIKRMKQGEIR